MTPAKDRKMRSWRRFAFCSAVTFLVLVSLPLPFSAIPYGGVPFVWLDAIVKRVVPFIGAHLFHVDAHFIFLGSGDTYFDYVRLFVLAVVSLAIALPWSTLDRNQARYARLATFFQIYLRYALAVSMISYGVGKILSNQFPRPALDVLVLPYGDSTIMRLGWTFMGAVPNFQRFAGWAEVISGFLLVFRRTSLLGALLAIGVLVNVAAFNFFYDVAAKLQPLHLLALAIAIVVPHRRRLLNFFVRNRAAEPDETPPLFARRSYELGAIALRTLFIAAVFIVSVRARVDWQLHSGDRAPRSPLRGIWNVDELSDNGIARPPLVTDAHRWRRIIFDGPLFGTIIDMDDTRHWHRVKLTPANVMLTTMDEKKKIVLAYARPDPGTLVVDTNVDGHTIHAVCHRMDERHFLLTSHHPHWVNEYPLY
jgi:hypothetical protein